MQWIFTNMNWNWRSTGIFSRSLLAQRREFSENMSYHLPVSDQPSNSAFCRFENPSTSGFTSYKKKFPQNFNKRSRNVVRFTTTDNSFMVLSDLRSWIIWCLRTRTLIKFQFPDLASISSTSVPETLKKIVVWQFNLCWTQEHLAQLFFRTVWEVCQLQHPITIQKTTKVTKT